MVWTAASVQIIDTTWHALYGFCFGVYFFYSLGDKFNTAPSPIAKGSSPLLRFCVSDIFCFDYRYNCITNLKELYKIQNPECPAGNEII